jgi:SAM-dependent methyltransferase
MRRLARERGVGVICGKAEALPFRDGRLDYDLMVTVICFFDDVRQAFREAYRVLKPSGSLVVAFIDRESPLGKKYDERKKETVYYAAATFHSAEEVRGYLGEAGFRSFTVCQTIFGKHGEMKEPDPVRDGHGAGCFRDPGGQVYGPDCTPRPVRETESILARIPHPCGQT